MKLVLNPINEAILSLLKEHQEGLLTITIAKEIKADYFIVYQRLLRLKKANLVFQDKKLWKLNDNGKDFLLNGLLRLPRRAISEEAHIQSKAIPPKRINGMEAQFRPLRTEYSRLEAIFAEASLSYETKRVKNSNQYILSWLGYSIKLTTRKLIAYAPQAYASFEIEGKVLINEELNKAMNAVGSLVKQLGLKMVREGDRLWCRCSYFEIAHTESKQADVITMKRRKSSFAPMAYDLNTLKMLAWADRSFRVAESEYSSLDLEAKEANRMQDIKDGKYYHRDEQIKLARVSETLEKVVELLELQKQGNERQEEINGILLRRFENPAQDLKKPSWRAG